MQIVCFSYTMYRYDCTYRYMWAQIRCTCMPQNRRNRNHQLSFNYFLKILFLYDLLLLYNILLYITIIYLLFFIYYSYNVYIYIYIYILYYYIIQLLSKNSTLSYGYGSDHNAVWQAYIMTLPVYRFYIEVFDASSQIYNKYIYTSEIPHISSLNYSP